ncbi:MAG: alpha/beta hydrolase [Patiriisocius sp.]|uniref:alpha/beta hydrolase n=1 Tax=Patiriisocius sp. TaxID=2822396 RepID=UPI003EF31E24
MSNEKRVNYISENTFETLNNLTSKTKNVWLVFHGLGYLSRYFLRSFETLNAEENYFIAPQAPSKYYLGTKFKHVGACWLTKENTKTETQNVLNYIDAVYKAEISETPVNFIVLGYSQGVSIATRWLSSRKIQCNHLILHSGGIPTELIPEDFEYLNPKTKVTYLYGDADEYINEAKKTEELLKGTKLFGDRLETQVFKGIHEVHIPSLEKFVGKS